MKQIPVFLSVVCLFLFCKSEVDAQQKLVYSNDKIKTGAEQTEKYVDYLKGKRVAILGNQSSVIGKTHLVDSLLALKINIVKIFGPEHGFRGNASNGTEVSDEVDTKTGIRIISLYGDRRKPSAKDLADVDLFIFDVQDMGVRFYTNINTLRDIMEACADNGKELMILDRPNPNAYLIDGPILDMKHKSGIGQFPVPVAHGMTIAEFAQMINGEKWMKAKTTCKLKIIPVSNYKHSMLYKLPVNPSPNLNTEESILLYPSTCLFEGTKLNHGRGTDYPFTVIGSPVYKGIYSFSFTPVSKKGMSESPLFMNQVCYGLDLRKVDLAKLVASKKLNLDWMKELYRKSPEKSAFFDRSFSTQIGSIETLAGVSDFRKQIESGASDQEIRKSWEPGLTNYKKMRKKYVIYKD
ncbi:exo-beta-N-acetylmuramidase NamZ family protein [Sphingobacterium spiritivorum]|uniref:exo-beta-N-acetylmuramidase NamZ family protein n=1 Tax=Sphingobacterium spiritivorum TaxID=258 RepID=UPI003DA604E5